MTLLDNMKILMPLTPDPPDLNMEIISNALEAAITAHIRISFIPGFGQTFMAGISSISNPFLISLSSYFDLVLSPIISAAAAASQPNIGNLPAWLSVQPAFDALIPIVPPFMIGIFGAIFWTALILTIRFSLPPPPSLNGNNSGDEREEVLRIDR